MRSVGERAKVVVRILLAPGVAALLSACEPEGPVRTNTLTVAAAPLQALASTREAIEVVMTTEHAVERQAAARQVFRSKYRLNHEPQSSGEFTTKVTYLDEGSIDGRPIPASRRSLAGLHLERAAGTATGIPRRGAVPDPRSPQAAAAGLGIGLPQFGSRTSAGVPSASRTMPHPLSRMLLDRVGRAQTLERLRNAFGQGVRQSGSTVRFSRTRGDTLLELVADDSLGVVRSTRVSIAGTPRLHVSYSYVNFSHDTLLVETIRVRGEPQAGRPALESSTTVLAIRRTPKP